MLRSMAVVEAMSAGEDLSTGKDVSTGKDMSTGKDAGTAALGCLSSRSRIPVIPLAKGNAAIA